MANEWLEKELEDYIVANQREFCGAIYPVDMFEISLLGRQVHCQFGIIDLLFWVRNVRFSYAVVVECKAKHEKGYAVEQVTRYESAIRGADIYDDTPSDAWPIFGTDYHGWARYIDIETLPVIVAPSFDEKLIPAFRGALVVAKHTGSGFAFERIGGAPAPEGQDQLNQVLRPVIKRAHIDAKAHDLLESLKGGTPRLYPYSTN